MCLFWLRYWWSFLSLGFFEVAHNLFVLFLWVALWNWKIFSCESWKLMPMFAFNLLFIIFELITSLSFWNKNIIDKTWSIFTIVNIIEPFLCLLFNFFNILLITSAYKVSELMVLLFQSCALCNRPQILFFTLTVEIYLCLFQVGCLVFISINYSFQYRLYLLATLNKIIWWMNIEFLR